MNCNIKCPAIRLVMFPKDTNPAGNIFGGIILSHIDVAGAIAARLHSKHRMVTVCMKEVVFKRPVKVGDILTCWTDVVSKGRTSVTVKIKVEAERHGEVIHVTDGEAIYVAVDAQDRPIALDSPAVADDRADISPAGGASTVPAPAVTLPAVIVSPASSTVSSASSPTASPNACSSACGTENKTEDEKNQKNQKKGKKKDKKKKDKKNKKTKSRKDKKKSK